MTALDRMEKLAQEIERIFIGDPADAETLIEAYLARELKALSNQEKRVLLEKNGNCF